MNNKENKTKTIKIALIIVVIAVIIESIFLISNINKILDKPDNPKSSSINASDRVAELLSEQEESKVLDSLETKLSFMRSLTPFINVQNGEDSYVYIAYSSNHEMLSIDNDTGYIGVYLNDGNSVQFTDYISYTKDSDAITLLECAVKLAKADKANVLRSLNEAIPEGSDRLYIDITGWDNIKRLYSYIDTSFAEEMVQVLQENVANSDINTNEITFRFIYYFSDESGIIESGACTIYFDKSQNETIKEEELQTSWLYNGCHFIGEWQLSDDWYTQDWDSLGDWTEEQLTVLETMLDKQFNTVNDLVVTHFELDAAGDGDVDIDSSNSNESDGTDENITNTADLEGPSKNSENQSNTDNSNENIENADN